MFWPSRGCVHCLSGVDRQASMETLWGTYREDPGAAAPPSATLGSPGQTQQRWVAPVHLLGYFRPRGGVVRRERRESRTEPMFLGAPVRDGSAPSRVSALCSLAWAKDERAARSSPWWARLPRGTSLPGPERLPGPASRPTSGGPTTSPRQPPRPVPTGRVACSGVSEQKAGRREHPCELPGGAPCSWTVGAAGCLGEAALLRAACPAGLFAGQPWGGGRSRACGAAGRGPRLAGPAVGLARAVAARPRAGAAGSGGDGGEPAMVTAEACGRGAQEEVGTGPEQGVARQGPYISQGKQTGR